jgi:hypothetical protein
VSYYIQLIISIIVSNNKLLFNNLSNTGRFKLSFFVVIFVCDVERAYRVRAVTAGCCRTFQLAIAVYCRWIERHARRKAKGSCCCRSASMGACGRDWAHMVCKIGLLLECNLNTKRTIWTGRGRVGKLIEKPFSSHHIDF